MKQKEKELLLQDLCARLPHGVYVHIRYKEGEPCYGKLTPRDIQWFIDSKIETIKPYLRPMSSITEEEIKKYKCLNDALDENYEVHIDKAYPAFDWLNANHFDFRNLIERRLAIEVTEENNPYENQDNIS